MVGSAGLGAGNPQDEAYGSRWCIRECRFRERTWESSGNGDQTNKAYRRRCAGRGWADGRHGMSRRGR